MKITLKAARVNAGLYQDEAAKKLDITRATLSNYENEKTAIPAKTFMKMLKLYRVKEGEIFFNNP